MFGIINPPNAAGAASSVASMMPAMAANDSAISASMTYTNSMTAGSVAAANWGANMDMSNMPAWAQSAFAENVLYTRAFLGANPDVLKSDGSVDLSAASTNAMMLPQDVAAAAASGTSSSSAAQSATSATGSAAAAASSSSSAGTLGASSNGAGVMSASPAMVGIAAVIVAALAL